MGDLNIDLLKRSDEFETTFYSRNIIPTISEATQRFNLRLLFTFINDGIKLN